MRGEERERLPELSRVSDNGPNMIVIVNDITIAHVPRNSNIRLVIILEGWRAGGSARRRT